MSKVKEFCKRKNIEVSAKRYGVDALGAMAQGLFCSLLIGTIIKTIGQQAGIEFLVNIGTYASQMAGPAMACAIGFALQADPLAFYINFSIFISSSTINQLIIFCEYFN